MAKRRLTETEIERLTELREQGLTLQAVAKRIGCSESTVYWQCLKLGVEPSKPRKLASDIVGPPVVVRGDHVVRRFTRDEDEKLLALEAEGLSETQIGRAIGRRYNSVRARLMTLARREARAEASA